jgi:hypothetical protein
MMSAARCGGTATFTLPFLLQRFCQPTP